MEPNWLTILLVCILKVKEGKGEEEEATLKVDRREGEGVNEEPWMKWWWKEKAEQSSEMTVVVVVVVVHHRPSSNRSQRTWSLLWRRSWMSVLKLSRAPPADTQGGKSVCALSGHFWQLEVLIGGFNRCNFPLCLCLSAGKKVSAEFWVLKPQRRDISSLLFLFSLLFLPQHKLQRSLFIYSANAFLMKDASHAGGRRGGRQLIFGSAQLWKRWSH